MATILSFGILVGQLALAQNLDRICAECLSQGNAWAVSAPVDQPFQSWMTTTLDPVNSLAMSPSGLLQFPTSLQYGESTLGQTNWTTGQELPGTLHAPWMTTQNGWSSLTMPVFVTNFYDSRTGFHQAGGLWGPSPQL